MRAFVIDRSMHRPKANRLFGAKHWQISIDRALLFELMPF